MVRKTNNRKTPMPNYLRTRMHRDRKKLREARQQQLNIERNDSIVFNGSSNTDNDRNNSNSFNNPFSLKSKLRDWANSFRVSKRAIDSLLEILNSNGLNLPKNHRTLLRTPLNIEFSEVAGGEFWYSGLETHLKNIFSTLDRDVTINLNFNIDGLPLYNSSKISFWPILASISGMCGQTM